MGQLLIIGLDRTVPRLARGKRFSYCQHLPFSFLLAIFLINPVSSTFSYGMWLMVIATLRTRVLRQQSSNQSKDAILDIYSNKPIRHEVPCHKFLYNMIDTNVGHFRRYEKKDLESKIRKARFTIERMFYFNMLGIIGWYINGNLAKSPKINGNASKLLDKMVPLLKYAEKMTGKKIGLSLVCYLKND